MNPETLALTVPCPLCEAAQGDRCVTRSGRRAARLHNVRSQPFYAAWSNGYHEGQRDTLRSLVDRGLVKVESLPRWLRQAYQEATS